MRIVVNKNDHIITISENDELLGDIYVGSTDFFGDFFINKSLNNAASMLPDKLTLSAVLEVNGSSDKSKNSYNNTITLIKEKDTYHLGDYTAICGKIKNTHYSKCNPETSLIGMRLFNLGLEALNERMRFMFDFEDVSIISKTFEIEGAIVKIVDDPVSNSKKGHIMLIYTTDNLFEFNNNSVLRIFDYKNYSEALGIINDKDYLTQLYLNEYVRQFTRIADGGKNDFLYQK